MPKRDMLINSVPGEECRIAIIEDGKLEELYHERTSIESHVGSIFKAKVTNVEPSIQAAFVDFGLERNGFLHVTDLHPRYFPGQHKEETERVGFKTPHRERPPIQKCLKRGQEILVQVIKEGLGSKGPTVTSYLSIPGRFLVMMPAMERLGVSRKVDDDDARRAMRKILDELNPPPEFGFIIRTAGIGRPKTDLKRDLSYLLRLWKNLERKMEQPGVGELYTESDLMIRTIRDVYSTDIDRIIVDDPAAAKRASDFLAIASPRAKSNVLFYDDPIPLFHRFGVEAQIETIHARRVPLPSGGSLVIDSTEALVAIDVNSGKMRNSGDAETTAYRTNVEACDEVCRQLRLRDLGGVVVIDLIDMRAPQKRRAIEQRFRDNLKKDRARTKPLAISQFGILEMTRQRMRPALTKSVYDDCHYCRGEGTVKNLDSIVMDVMRRLSLVVHRKEVAKLAVIVSPDVAFPLLNRKRGELVAMEQKYNTPIQVRVNPSGAFDFIELMPMDERGTVLNIDGSKNLAPPIMHPVESMPVDDELIDDEVETHEMEARATVVERIDETGSATDEEIRESRGEAILDDGAEDDDDAGSSRQGTEQRGEGSSSGNSDGASQGEGGRRKRKRRRRRGRGGKIGEGVEGAPAVQAGEGDAPVAAPHQRPPQGQPRPQQNQPGNRQNQPRPPQGQARPPQQQQGGGQRAPQVPRDRQQQPGSAPLTAAQISRGYLRADEIPSKPPTVIDDNIGNRKENIGSQSSDEIDGPSSGGSDQGGPIQYGPDGQPLRKKRRRRGGRRHRRRREAKLRAEQERAALGLPPLPEGAGEMGDDQGDDHDSRSDGRSDGDERDTGSDGRDDGQSDQSDDDARDLNDAADEANNAAPQEIEADEADESDDAGTEDADAAVAAPAPKKKSIKPAAKSAGKTTKKKPAAKTASKKVTKRPRRKPPARKPPQSQAMADDVTVEPKE